MRIVHLLIRLVSCYMNMSCIRYDNVVTTVRWSFKECSTCTRQNESTRFELGRLTACIIHGLVFAHENGGYPVSELA